MFLRLLSTEELTCFAAIQLNAHPYTAHFNAAEQKMRLCRPSIGC